MKITPARAEAFIAKPDPAIKAVLVYGPDDALVRERVARLVAGVVGETPDPFRLSDVAGAELAKDPARLTDEAAALSLTGGRRAIRVRDATDGVTAALRNTLDAATGDSLIVIEAGDLNKSSSLRKLCETAPAAAAMACYAADAQTISRLVRDALGGAGVGIDAEAMDVLADRVGLDRQVARQAAETLITYAGEDRRIDAAAVDACVGDQAERSLNDLAFAVADGDVAAADRAIAIAQSHGVAPVAALRAVQRHFGRLHRAVGLVANGTAPDQAMARLRPPVFFKEQPRWRRQMNRWSPDRLGRCLDALLDAERKCKSTGVPDDALWARTCLDIARTRPA